MSPFTLLFSYNVGQLVVAELRPDEHILLRSFPMVVLENLELWSLTWKMVGVLI